MKFKANDVVEDWVAAYGVKFSLEHIELDKINKRKSRENRARLAAPLIPQHVDKLTIANDDGASFPPLIVYRHGKQYVIIDGNHRHEVCCGNGATTALAYTVHTDDPVIIDTMTRNANRDLNGAGQTDDEALHHAAHLVEHHNFTRKDAAKRCRISDQRLCLFLKAKETRSVVRGYVKNADDITNTKLAKLAVLGTITNVMGEAARVVEACKLNQTETDDFVRQIKGLDANEDVRLEFIAKYEDNIANILLKTAPKNVGPSDKHVKAGKRLAKLIRDINMHLDQYPTLEANAYTSRGDRKQLVSACEDAILALQELLR